MILGCCASYCGRTGLPARDRAGALVGRHRKREYCVQYRETDLNFVSRLMEQEGIYRSSSHG